MPVQNFIVIRPLTAKIHGVYIHVKSQIQLGFEPKDLHLIRLSQPVSFATLIEILKLSLLVTRLIKNYGHVKVT